MNRISLSSIYQAAAGLDPLDKLPVGRDLTFGEIYLDVMMALGTLENLLERSDIAPHFRSSTQHGRTLLENLRSYSRRLFTDKINQIEVWQIKNEYSQYKVALLAEFGIVPSYLVSQKSTYDTLALLERGHLLFPDEIISKVPECIIDLSEAGKALAFDMPTACGFHIFRATESVLRRYYKAVTGGSAEPKVRNISVYINAMRQAKKGDQKVLNALKQLSDLHRNPLAHPEVILTSDEAMATIGMARSVVTQMLPELPVEKLTTGNPPLGLLGAALLGKTAEGS